MNVTLEDIMKHKEKYESSKQQSLPKQAFIEILKSKFDDKNYTLDTTGKLVSSEKEKSIEEFMSKLEQIGVMKEVLF